MKFLKNANCWSLTPDAQLDVRAALPPGNYTVCRNPITGEYFLEETAGFIIPGRLYGKIDSYTERIARAFEHRKPQSQVGVLLCGSKGSGKTLLAKNIAAKSGLPTIIVNTPFTDERFMRTLQGIEQPAIIIIDEFEKLYDKEGQEAILTLFDGVYTVRNKILIVTCNDKWSVQDFFHNRPSRLRYSIDFSGLESAFIEEYCTENLHAVDAHLKKIVDLAALCEEFNFDMLQTLVEELNRFGGTVDEAVEILNIKPVMLNGRDIWSVQVVTPEAPKLKWRSNGMSKITSSPLTLLSPNGRGEGVISFDISLVENSGSTGVASDEDGLDEEEELSLKNLWLEMTASDLVKIDPVTNCYVFNVREEGMLFEVSFVNQSNKGHNKHTF